MNPDGNTHAPDCPLDLGQTSTDGILATLEEIGLSTDRDGFRALARRQGSPSSLASSWLAALGEMESPLPPGNDPNGAPTSLLPEVPVVAAAWELWKRWAPDISSAEILAEEFDRHYEPLDTLLMGSPGLLCDAIQRADRILSACSPPGEPPDQDLFQEIWSHCWHDLATWLRCLPLILAQKGQLDSAIRLCERLAPLFESRVFLSERGILLARAGRESEARRQVSANVRRWPRDPVVLKKACETLWSMCHSDEALLLYDEVLHLTGQARRSEG
ncbi:MAG: hypothetical protein SGI90_13795 [Candidatus Eisenbacteria bacterium]|nr:hypothetical protein [Candidatus Eisenbacteria bacterium]